MERGRGRKGVRERRGTRGKVEWEEGYSKWLASVKK